jgi:hypothetical protein
VAFLLATEPHASSLKKGHVARSLLRDGAARRWHGSKTPGPRTTRHERDSASGWPGPTRWSDRAWAAPSAQQPDMKLRSARLQSDIASHINRRNPSLSLISSLPSLCSRRLSLSPSHLLQPLSTTTPPCPSSLRLGSRGDRRRQEARRRCKPPPPSCSTCSLPGKAKPLKYWVIWICTITIFQSWRYTTTIHLF